MHEGDIYHVGDEVFIVTGDEDAVTGQDLRTGDHAIEVSDPLLQDEGMADPDGQIAVINCVGLAIACNVVADHTATFTVDVTDASIPAAIAGIPRSRPWSMAPGLASR